MSSDLGKVIPLREWSHGHISELCSYNNTAQCQEFRNASEECNGVPNISNQQKHIL